MDGTTAPSCRPGDRPRPRTPTEPSATGWPRARGYRDRQIERYFEEERKRQEAVELRRLACTERLLTCSSFLEQRDEVRSCRGRS
jgi:hypothetical protein